MQQALRRRREWINRNPEVAVKYIRLSANDKAKVDILFEEKRTSEATGLVERLDEKRRIKNRVIDTRRKALKNIREKLGDRPRFRDATVAKNVDVMTPTQMKMAATADVDDLIYLARLQTDQNPFWYH